MKNQFRILLTLLTIGLLSQVQTTCPMWRTIRAKLPRAINIGLSFGPFAIATIKGLTSSDLSDAMPLIAGDVSPEARSVINRELSAVGVVHPEHVKVQKFHVPSMPSNRCNMLTNSLTNTLYVSCPNATEPTHLESALATQNLPAINEHRFTLQHEGMHLTYKDAHSKLAALITLPIITHAVSRGISLINPLVRANPASFVRNIAAGILKGTITTNNFNYLERYKEQRADDGVINEYNILTGGYNGMNAEHQLYLERATALSAGDKNLTTFAYNYSIDQAHPTPEVRMQKFKQRLEALKEKEPA